MIDLNAYRDAFLQDARETVQLMRSALAALEKNPSDQDRMQELMRLFHSFKSSSAIMGYKDLSAVSFAKETELQEMIAKKSAVPELLLQDAAEVVMKIDKIASGSQK